MRSWAKTAPANRRLSRLLTGVYLRSGGEVYWEGQPVALATPHEAIELRHQRGASGSCAVSASLGRCQSVSRRRKSALWTAPTWCDGARGSEDSRRDRFKLPAAALLSALTIGQQQLVATARASTRGTRFLIFDEPTAYLTRQEAAQLFALIRRLKANGVTIVYISHRLEEVFQLADRVSILRDGQLVSTQRVAETNEQALITGMINRTHRADAL